MNYVTDYIKARAHCPVSDEPRIGMKYMVAPGDNLETISAKAYNTRAFWGNIYIANISTIGGDANMIRSHTSLYIPDPSIINDMYDPFFAGHRSFFAVPRQSFGDQFEQSKRLNRAVVSIQILPFVSSKSKDTIKSNIECLTEGADIRTEGYGVYLRLNDGSVSHYDDAIDEHQAIKVAKEMCEKYSVGVEPYPWQQNLVKFSEAEKAFCPPEPFFPVVMKATCNTGGFMAVNPETVFVWNHAVTRTVYHSVIHPGEFVELDPNLWDIVPATLDEILQHIVKPAVELVKEQKRLEQEEAIRKPRPNFEYVTREGDMFADIAAAAYGAASLGAIIVGANKDKDIHAAHLPSNITLRIPPDPSNRNQPAAGHQYITQLGDTLETIARSVYGDETMARTIIDANGNLSYSYSFVRDDYLPKDMCLDIPEYAPREEKPSTHTTKLGESLSDAAVEIYGNEEMWRALALANNLQGGHAMAGLPLAVGTVLQIPKQL